MSHALILVLGLLAMADPPGPESPEARRLRAALVDHLMAGPPPPRFASSRSLSVEGAAAEPPGGPGGDDEEAVAPAPDSQGLRLDRSNFDRWLFGDKDDDRSRREWLAHRLDGRIFDLLIAGPLSTAQVEKLRLAGKGDIERFRARVDAMRAKFEGLRSDFDEGQNFLSLGLGPLSKQFEAGPFGDGSLFAKTLRKIAADREGGGPSPGPAAPSRTARPSGKIPRTAPGDLPGTSRGGSPP